MRVSIPILLILVLACGDDSSSTDASTDMDGATTCTDDASCDDGLFCTGTATCDPDSPDADVRGCVATGDPCVAPMECSEDMDRCINADCTNPDADGDGVAAAECGGADCDDGDPGRFPGNTEVCDSMDRDEDCDPATFGVRDLDMDDEPDGSCCNPDGAGGFNCGTDCDDTRAGVSPTATEVCNGRDDDCDSNVDEGVLVTYTIDVDGDTHGSDAEDAETMVACPGMSIEGYAEGPADDCDDDDSGVNPGLAESCDDSGRDENCNGVVDEDCTCTFPSERPCEEPGICSMGIQACDALTGRYGPCSIEPESMETVCNGLDEDCDGRIDEGTTVQCYTDVDEDTYPEDGATVQNLCPDFGRAFVGTCPSNTTNRVPTVDTADCNDSDSDVHPDAAEICDLVVDHDCDGTVDEGATVGCYVDDDNDTYSPLGSPLTARCPDAGRGVVGGCPVNWTNRMPNASSNDCNDVAPGGSVINPAATELCDMASVDENCNGMMNEGCECSAGDPDIACEMPFGRCAAGTRSCEVPPGAYGMCSISPLAEMCNGEDDDCDDNTDETFECVQNAAPVACTHPTCGTPGMQGCSGSCTLEACAATEVCNGCDDDNDGPADEDFDCEQGTSGVSCTTACGTSGSGTCNGSCNIINCYASSESCNFCDDDGMPATTDEPLATGTVSSQAECDTLDLHMAACIDGFADRVILINGGTSSDRGAAYYDPSGGLYFGWGELTQAINVRASEGTSTYPADGWALVLADGGSGFVGGTGGDLAIPEARQGLVIEWHFFTGFAVSSQSDCVRVARLDGDGERSFLHGGNCAVVPPASMHLDQGDGAVVQELFVRYTPNDPATPGNTEEVLEIYFNDDGSGSPAWSLDGLPSPPPFCMFPPCFSMANDLNPGSPLLLGVTAASGGHRSTVEWRTGIGAGAVPVSQLRRSNVCF